MADETQDISSNKIVFSGLGSGTDFDSIIKATVEVEKFRIKRLNVWKSSWQTKVDNFQQLNTKMLSLKTSLEGMDTLSEFLVKGATVADSSVFTATANSSAQVAAHTVQVNQLAKNDMWVGSHAFASATATVNNSGSAQTFAYTYGAANVSVEIGAGTTLTGLVNAINTDPDNPGVRAAAIKVADGDYRLQIWGMDLGASYQFSVGAGTTLSNVKASDMAQTQNAQNSQVKVDGFPSAAGSWIERSTNSLSDVIEGLTLNLKGTGSSSVSTAVDKDAVKENVRTFVDKINEVREYILDITKFNSTTQKASVLTGNYGVQLISTRLKELVAGKGTGFDYDDDAISVLSQIGITTDATEDSATRGLLVLDEEILDEALDSNPDELAQLLAADFVGGSNSSNFSYYSHIDNLTKAGTYALSYTVDGSGNITGATINGRAATVDNSTHEITGLHGYDEAGLVIKVTNLTAGSYSGEVRLKQGKAGQLAESLKDLTSSTSGPLHILEENYQDIMDNIDKKIEREETRITALEEHLRERYARLEAVLGNYNNISSSLSNQINQLPRGNS
ncbi:MAG: flagellar filament capping protein FliD [Thermodesulfobacteriota bacterium]